MSFAEVMWWVGKNAACGKCGRGLTLGRDDVPLAKVIPVGTPAKTRDASEAVIRVIDCPNCGTEIRVER